MPDPHALLGVAKGASAREVKRAYRRLIKANHPDRFAGDEARRREAEETVRRLNQAYRTLLESAPQRFSPRPAIRAAATLQRRFPLFFASVLALGALSVAMVFLYFLMKEKGRHVRVNGVAFSEWEWASAFRPGSTKDEVLALQGAPEKTLGDIWYYGRDWVRFAGGRVASYSNAGKRLRARVPAADRAAYGGKRFVTLGDPPEAVAAVQGQPVKVIEKTWYYGSDWVGFDERGLSRYSNEGGRLKIRLEPGAPVSVKDGARFAVGSSRDELIAIQGTPDRVEGSVWYYGMDSVILEDDVVRTYSNISRKLRVRRAAS
jgi:PAS domain-containing protein